MRAELKRLHQALGSTIIFVTHDQMEAMTLATSIAVMNNGVIEQLAKPMEIYRTPKSLFVAKFVGSPPMNVIQVENGGEIKAIVETIQPTGADWIVGLIVSGKSVLHLAQSNLKQK